FHLINTVNKRAIDASPISSRADTLKMANYVNSRIEMETLLLEERQREFLFEGKRWFDLVRTARRDGSNSRLSTLATRKYIENVNAIKIKLANPNRIYFPYFRNELKVNPLLKQNSAYADTEDTELTTKR
ncbi:MAG: RagB/SusD family nutrient uptake outer membrane protein, partial [Bacteroidaceae bacterium]|nr:RagB/SusD family nutrient uptake outer membrane protein [Bacteroidaceae bacterium]